MSWLLRFYRSAIGKKMVMAVSGIILFGFVLVHMAGNLKLYAGAEAMNQYGEFLRDVGKPLLPREGLLWIARIVLLGAVVAHIDAAVKLTLMNRKARPVGYRHHDYVQASYASRTMRWGGLIILLFILYHLAHFTVGAAHPDFRHGEPYHNVVVGFSSPLISAIYILANLALGLHLYHGLWSMFQSMGWNHPKFNPWRRKFAILFAIVVTLGNISFPIAVLAGVVG